MRMRQHDRCGKEILQRHACRTLCMKSSCPDMASKPQQRPPIGFCGMLWRLLVLLRPLPALFLVALSFLEAILVFKGGCQYAKTCSKYSFFALQRQLTTCIFAVGQVAGQYYLIIVDQQHSLFIRTTLISAALYACNTIVKSTSLWLSELLAYRSDCETNRLSSFL